MVYFYGTLCKEESQQHLVNIPQNMGTESKLPCALFRSSPALLAERVNKVLGNNPRAGPFPKQFSFIFPLKHLLPQGKSSQKNCWDPSQLPPKKKKKKIFI
jgi:hypothetical protein